MPFEPLSQEPAIQQRWMEAGAFRAKRATELLPDSKTFYMLVMLPYPSGRIHMGHVRNYTLGDIVARFRRMRGEEVLHPLGWDSFGLPAENAAIKHGIHPAIWTRQNIADMKAQIQKIGISYDWEREIASYLPEYYRWNQWFFLQMWKRGDVFRAERFVNWCEELGTVLANEQVVDGKDERTGFAVVQKPLEQYFFQTTKYADELLSGLEQIDWPENVKTMQRHWIGKSEGARLTFTLATGETVEVFTTRLDTLFGVSFLALSTEHPLIEKAAETDPALKSFCDEVASISREERLTSDVKLGHRSKLEALHPFTGEKVPVYAANYVLMDYGTGAVMGVPAHDERDQEFAEKYGLPIVKVIEGEDTFEHGTLIASGEFTGLGSEAAVDAMVAKLGGRASKATTFKLKDWGLSRQRYWGTPIPTVHCPACGVVPEKEENLPIRLPEDVAFTGVGPSPLTTSRTFLDCSCPQCGKPSRRETDTMDTFVDSSWYWMRYLDPTNGTLPFAKAESDAWMPVDLYIGGIEHATMHLIYARYFFKVLRDLEMVSGDEPFTKLICQGMVLKDGSKMSKSKGNIVDPDEVLADFGADALRLFMTFAAPIEKELDWTGFEGIEGATRFLKRVSNIVEMHLFSEEVTTEDEKALIDQALNALGERPSVQFGQILAKIETQVRGVLHGNALIERELRPHLRELIDDLLDIDLELAGELYKGIHNNQRFAWILARVLIGAVHLADVKTGEMTLPDRGELSPKERTLLVKLHQTIRRLTGDLETRYSFNTVVSGLMELSNAIGDLPADAPHRNAVMQHALEAFVLMLSPVAPHAAEALWTQLGGKGFAMHAAWPSADPGFLEADEALVVVQVNGKVRGRITVPSSATEEDRRAAALACADVKTWIDGKEIVKVVVPPGGKLVSVVIK